MKYFLVTIGCQMNDADARYVAAELERRGYAPAAQLEEANLILLNTCVVRQQAENKALARLRELAEWRARRPELRIILMGCLVGARPSPDFSTRFPFVDVFLPPSDIGPLLRFLDEQGERDRGERDRERQPAGRKAPANELPVETNDEEAVFPPSRRGEPTAGVPVVLGCSQACTYCVIPYRRGRERSRLPQDVLSEVRRLAEAGVREVTLLGQIIDRYGKDLLNSGDLADLLGAVADIDGLARVRFLTSHPSYLSERIIRTVAENPKICPVFELPIQAGSDAVLAAMRRGYTSADYRRLTDRIRSAIPHAALHTDIIVGFPGETEDQFEQSVRIVEEIGFQKIHIARYSPRPLTWAARHLIDNVPPAEKTRRQQRIEAIQKAIQTRQNAALIGTTVEVLVDGRDELRGRWRGRSADDRLVFFSSSRARPGDLIRVHIEWTGPFTLIGRDPRAGNEGPLPPALSAARGT